eukprot:GHVR01034690.1.p1 GENE.GHVR01034690.1~~GHVR01034690.1.p1  ORF type:complete len:156 (+),score=38.55 GHVR01034690.1:92-559(+)
MALKLCRLLRASASEAVTNRLLLTLASPTECIISNKPVESVTVPGAEGEFTVTNNHSEIVSQLSPGVITVKVNNNDINRYFISDGFTIFNAVSDSTGCCTAEVIGTEIVPVDMLDKERVPLMMTQLLTGPKDTDWDKAKIILGQKLLSAVMKAAH